MLEYLQNRPEVGPYRHDMGLREAMAEPQSVWKLAEQEQVDFKVDCVRMGVETRQGFFAPEEKGEPMVNLHFRTDTHEVLTPIQGRTTCVRTATAPSSMRVRSCSVRRARWCEG